MKKIIIYSMMMLVLLSFCFATTTRSVSNNVVTYTTNLGSTYTKAYWAVYEVVPAGCTVSSVSCNPSGGLGDCGYYAADNSIRAVGYTAETGGSMSTSIAVTVVGTGSCSLTNGQYVESYNDGTAHLGAATPIAGSLTLNLVSGSCNTDADTNCDGCVADTEFPNAVADWKGAQIYISDSEFPIVVNNWKQQTGC